MTLDGLGFLQTIWLSGNSDKVRQHIAEVNAPTTDNLREAGRNLEVNFADVWGDSRSDTFENSEESSHVPSGLSALRNGGNVTTYSEVRSCLLLQV